jgi:hypothetical protein
MPTHAVLGPTVSVGLLHERELIEAVISREQLKQFAPEVGSRCRIRLRLPTIFQDRSRPGEGPQRTDQAAPAALAPAASQVTRRSLS